MFRLDAQAHWRGIYSEVADRAPRQLNRNHEGRCRCGGVGKAAHAVHAIRRHAVAGRGRLIAIAAHIHGGHRHCRRPGGGQGQADGLQRHSDDDGKSQQIYRGAFQHGANIRI